MTSHPIRAAAALLALAAAQPASSQTTAPPPVTHLRQVVDSLAQAGRFSGVVVLTRNGEPVLELAHGMADREAGRANDVETAFNLGSLNKLFTRIAVEQLVAEGRIHHDSTIAAYWPDYPNGDVSRRVTIAQLLEHRSGLGGNIFDAPPGGTRADIRHNRDFVQLFASEPLQFEPGTSRRYSNAGYVVLGEIVARVTGEDYYDYVRRSIYQPAGMTRTGHFAVDSLPPNTALGYTRGGRDARDDAQLRPNRELLPGRGSSAGGGYSTARDLLRFIAAARAGRIPAARVNGIGAAGGAPGLNAIIETDLPGGYDLVALTNLDPPSAENVGQLFREMVDATP
ncbi:MAG: beta-lactamase family protein [Gemmatimonadota bacterium]|nr:beta-lactamase family protein [Gemmatimonadota bacterium]